MNKIEKAIKRREWVNKKFGEQTRNKNLTNKQKTKLLKKLWKEARKKYN